MRLRYRLKNLRRIIQSAFYPATTILLSLIAVTVVDIILGVLMMFQDSGTLFYDILFAMITGVTASFFVSMVIELSNNYKSNRLAGHELDAYFRAVLRYMLMVNMEQKKYKDFDIVKTTWKQIPDIMPIIKETLQNKKIYLRNEEIEILQEIELNYMNIRMVTEMIVIDDFLHNVLNHPDESVLGYPSTIVMDMPENIRMHIASKMNQKELDRYVDEVLQDKFMFRHYLRGYRFSKDKLNYDEIDRECPEPDFEILDDADLSEEEFIEQNKKMAAHYKKWNKSYVCHMMSISCNYIAGYLDELAKYIEKRPWYGIEANYFREEIKKKKAEERKEKPKAEKKNKANKKRKSMKRKGYETVGLLLGYLVCLIAIVITKVLEILSLISYQTAKSVSVFWVLVLAVGVIGYFIFYIIKYFRTGMKNVYSCGIPVFDEMDEYKEHWSETKEHYENMINVISFYYKPEGKVDEEVGSNLMSLYHRLEYLNGLIGTKEYLSNCMMSIGISFATSFIISYCVGEKETFAIRVVFLVASLLVIACVMIFPHSAMMKSGACGIFEYEKKQLLVKIENAENAVRDEEINEEALKLRKNALNALMKQNKKSFGKKSKDLDSAIRDVEKLNFNKIGKNE